ncbi:glycoside hydrolase family 73 protein [Levilactobacillus suantsaii]|uniref:N-acetylmuramidase n=1 Tax=Levilactobacillus suantsaii TaxID=2292255 RepID=A0A4Q0VIJ1_9LACO|nr:glycoside hydrolase family 73 protein [Levilactobacillus suantsaii]QMU08130.1 glycoside hydrolase family 73 protein [Levilactobacillus suantsaii]RXI79042.1 N-acetylmuramidase [Levilactobacillus suantsaii]
MPKRRRKNRQRNSHPAFATWLFVLVLIVVGGGMLVRGHIKTEIQNGVVTATSTSSSSGETAAQKKFIKKMAAPAVRVYHQNGQVLPSIVIAQAILESSWGTSQLFLQANNPFGVKGSYQGSSKSFMTTEYVNNKTVKVRANFRNYPNLTDAILDHDALLKQNYFKGTVTDYQTAAKLLQTNGYATDPHYARKLTNVIATYNLNQYDT